MADRFEQWSRARLGEYVTRDGETWATIVVPVDSAQHDPRADVIAALTGAPANNVPVDIDRRVMRDLAPSDEVEKSPTTRHRKTRGK